MTGLADWQVELDGLVIGQLGITGWALSKFDDGGIPDRATQDAGLPGADGARFGVDTIGGRTVKLTVGYSGGGAAGAFDAAGGLVRRWLGDSVRATPGAVQVLRIKRPGREALRLYGRPRKAAPVYTNAVAGWVPVTATFACSDHRYYADETSGATVPVTASAPRGYSWPLRWPLRIPGPVTTTSEVGNTGELETWLVVTFTGPVAGPEFELAGEQGGTAWRLAMPDLSLAAGEQVTVDPRPWVRTVLDASGGNRAGMLSRDSARMGDMLVPVGARGVSFTARDTTGTGSCVLSWRDAWASL